MDRGGQSQDLKEKEERTQVSSVSPKVLGENQVTELGDKFLYIVLGK